MVTLKIDTQANLVNGYQLWIDNQLWCTTQSDDDGMKLAIAIVKLRQQNEKS